MKFLCTVYAPSNTNSNSTDNTSQLHHLREVINIINNIVTLYVYPLFFLKIELNTKYS